VLDALRIPTIEKEGFEADDVIATLATQARADGHDVLIVSGDRDVFQLVADTTTVLYPVRGVSELTRMTPVAVQAKYGIDPPRYPDLAALVGETSDNLPGVPGVGPKTAAKWINQYGNLDGVVANVGEISGKAGSALREHLADVIRNRRVNQLVNDLDLPVSIDELVARPWDRDAVHRVFDGLEFRVLRDRLFATLSADEPTADEGFVLEGAELRGGEVAGWLAEHAGPGSPVGLHVVGSWGSGTGRVDGLALAAADGPRARRLPWPPAAGRWPGWPPTPHWPPIWPAPTSARTTSPT
jgi:DNA polymerase I